MTDKFVIDTNVTIVANGKDGKGKPTHASLSCQLACIELLQNCKRLHIAIDETNLIMEEYKKHLSHAGQPGVGDIFFKYLHDNQHSTDKIHSVTISKLDDESRGFDELPVNSLDISDRKFLATAIVAGATLVNATDSDWSEQRELLEIVDIGIKQLCPEHSCK